MLSKTVQNLSGMLGGEMRRGRRVDEGKLASTKPVGNFERF